MDKTTEQKVIETLIFINDAIKKDHHILINEGCPIHGRIERLINEINNNNGNNSTGKRLST